MASSYAQKVNFSGKILFSHDRMEPNFRISYYVDSSTTPSKSDKDRADYQADDRFWTEVYVSPTAKSIRIEITADGYEPFSFNVANVRFNEFGYLKVTYNANNFIKLKPLNIPRIADIKYRNSKDYSTHIMFITLFNPLKDTVTFSDIKMEARGIYESGITCLVPTPDVPLYSISDKMQTAILPDPGMFMNRDEDSSKFMNAISMNSVVDGAININLCDHYRDLDFNIHISSGIVMAPGRYTTVKVSVPEFINMERVERKDTRGIKINNGVSSFERYYFTISSKNEKLIPMCGNYVPPFDKQGMKGYFLNRESLLVNPENKVK